MIEWISVIAFIGVYAVIMSHDKFGKPRHELTALFIALSLAALAYAFH